MYPAPAGSTVRARAVFALAFAVAAAQEPDENLFSPYPHFGHIDGKFQLFHYGIDSDDEAKRARATALGGSMRYRTPKLYRFGMTLEYSGSHALGAVENPQLTELFKAGTDERRLDVLSEGHLSYQNATTYFRLGPQRLDTPLLNGDDTRIVPWSYEAASMTYAFAGKNKLFIAAVSRIRAMTSAHYEKESASGPIAQGLYLLGWHNRMVDNHTLHAYYYYVPELYDALYLQYDYDRPVNDALLLCFGVQHIGTFRNGGEDSHALREAASGGDDVRLLAVRLGMDYEASNVQLAYSENFGSSGINNGYGGLSRVYTSSMVANGRKQYEPRTWSLKARHEIYQRGPMISEVALQLTDTDYRDERGEDFFAWYAHSKLRFDKDTSLFVRYEHMDYAGISGVREYLRVIAEYRF